MLNYSSLSFLLMNFFTVACYSASVEMREAGGYQTLPPGAIIVPVAGGASDAVQVLVPAGGAGTYKVYRGGYIGSTSAGADAERTPLLPRSSEGGPVLLPASSAPKSKISYPPSILAIVDASQYKDQYYNIIGAPASGSIEAFQLIENCMRSGTAHIPTLIERLRPIACGATGGNPIAMEVLGDLLTRHTDTSTQIQHLNNRIRLAGTNSGAAAGVGLIRSAMISSAASEGYAEACALFKEAAKWYESGSIFYNDLMRRGGAVDAHASDASCSSCCKVGTCLSVFIGAPLVTMAILWFTGTIHF